MKVISNAPDAPKPIAAYSQAVVANGLVFTAGQIALDPRTGALVEGDIVAQTERVMKNLDSVLATCGSSFHHVVMTSIFLTDMANFKVVSEVYGRYVNQAQPPARQTLAVKQLPLDAMIEISLIATIKED